MTTLQQLFGMELAIIQAPMAGVQGSALAVAVSNAGGLGSLPCAMLGLDAMRSELAAIRAGTDRPFNVNFFCHAPPEPSAQREAAWRRAGPYYPSWNRPGRYRRGRGGALQRRSRRVSSSTGGGGFHRPASTTFDACAWNKSSRRFTVEEARWLEAHGVDAVIAQGAEAGGHRGMFLTEDLGTQAGTFALLPQIVRAVKLPVIAAGGIADAKGVAAAMALGAAGVQVGTAYLLCPEATTSAVHRAALKSEAARHTALTNLFTGRPARGIVNRVMKELGPINAAAPAFPLAGSAIAPLRAKAESRGLGDFSPLWCGQNASGCREIPAGELTQALAAGL
jgi:nitronate monooxygenase